MRDKLTAAARTGVAADSEWKQRGLRDERAAAVAAFLKAALAQGPVAVVELEVRAREASLLGNQSITDSKSFKRAKQTLGIKSHRRGFGPRAVWFWSLPILRTESVAHLAPELVVVDERHSRPEHSADAGTHSRPAGTPIETAPRPRIPLEWVRGVALLHRQTRPSLLPGHLWRLLVTDCERFLAPRNGWAERAAECGWDTAAIFGCSDPKRPFDHLAGAGLVWRVGGGRLTSIHSDWAVVEVNGVERVVHRRPAGARAALPWTLK
jgi:hypothetical protein